MDNLLDTIRAAVAPDATDDIKAAGATACRTILTTLEAKAGEPLAAAVTEPNPMATMVSMLRGVPPEQLLDLAIARLRSALPAGTQVQQVQPMKFHLVAVPPLARKQP
ncbi:MAG: hypothetical protein KF773_12315 [Deltaproteobacteria bacterium]|nr:hypothetical protein [Deltaproteobacteria bacterium]